MHRRSRSFPQSSHSILLLSSHDTPLRLSSSHSTFNPAQNGRWQATRSPRSGSHDPGFSVARPCVKQHISQVSEPPLSAVSTLFNHGSLLLFAACNSNNRCTPSSWLLPLQFQNIANTLCSPASYLSPSFFDTGCENRANSLTGGSCHRSPPNTMFNPPNGRGRCFLWAFLKAHGCCTHAFCRKKDSIVASKPTDTVLISSIRSQRMLMQFSNNASQSPSFEVALPPLPPTPKDIPAQLWMVFPPINSAIEF
eukprot:9064384-Pyramimonas_sp.AAC.1